MVERNLILVIEKHKVKSGETLKSLAESHGLTWQQLALFNWNTSDPDEINIHLRENVGCRSRTADGNNYVFTNEDSPGIVYIPSKFVKAGLATGRTHTIHVRPFAARKLKTVVVFLDIPHQSSSLQDRFRLVGQNGAYDRMLRRSEAVDEDERRVALHFTEVPPVGTYSLYQVLTPEIELPVFLDVPFADLPNYGEEGAAPSWEEPEKIALEAPPQVGSVDPLLAPDPADFALDPAAYVDLIAFRSRGPEDGSALA